MISEMLIVNIAIFLSNINLYLVYPYTFPLWLYFEIDVEND